MVSLQSLSTAGYETIKKEEARVLIEKGSQDEGAGNKLMFPNYLILSPKGNTYFMFFQL